MCALCAAGAPSTFEQVSDKGLEKSFHPIAHSAIDPEAMRAEPSNAIHVVSNRLVTDVFAPQDLVAQDILYYHQAKVAPPVCSVHQDGHILVF